MDESPGNLRSEDIHRRPLFNTSSYQSCRAVINLLLWICYVFFYACMNRAKGGVLLAV